MGAGPMARWKRSTLPELRTQLRWAVAASGASALLLGWLLPLGDDAAWKPSTAFGLLLAAWCVCSTLAHAGKRLGSGGEAGTPWHRRAARQPRSWWGMVLAHAGIGVFIFGATLATGFESKRELTLALGQPVTVQGFEFRITGFDDVAGPNYDAQRAQVQVSRSGRPLRVLQPEKRRYRAQEMPLSQAAIDTGLLRDLFVALGERIDERSWTVRIQVKPFMA